VPTAVAPWIVSDELWELIEPLLPAKERRFCYPGRKRLPDPQALQGILFVLAHRDLVDASRREPRAGQKGGAETGPRPVDRARAGSKHHLLVDATGLPLAW